MADTDYKHAGIHCWWSIWLYMHMYICTVGVVVDGTYMHMYICTVGVVVDGTYMHMYICTVGGVVDCTCTCLYFWLVVDGRCT